MNNFSIEYFHKQLIELINSSGLPVGIVYYILKDALVEVKNLYNDCLLTESQNGEKKEVKTFNINACEEEMENEGTNTDASEYSGSTNDN